jgi:hypothetical protein
MVITFSVNTNRSSPNTMSLSLEFSATLVFDPTVLSISFNNDTVPVFQYRDDGMSNNVTLE